MDLQWSPAWHFSADPTPVLSAGPDLSFDLEGLDAGSLDALLQWSRGGCTVDDRDGQTELRSMLVGFGASTPLVDDPIGISLQGDAPAAVRDILLDHCALADPADPAAVELLFRTAAAWPTPSHRVHLGIDLTHHHTLVLGPLVVPGVTSCLSCLDRLVTRRWGADIVADRPTVTRWHAVIAELVIIQLDGLRGGATGLVNATAAWNLADGTVEREALLRAPDCTGLCRAPQLDRLQLPWTRP